MKVLFQAPFLSPTWKGYAAHKLLEDITYSSSHHNYDLRTLNIKDELELLHKLGNTHEVLLDKTLLSMSSSLATYIQTFDIQILMCNWNDAWNLLLPNAVNIVIGLDNNPPCSYMLSNCLEKIHHSELAYNEGYADYLDCLDDLPSDSQFFQLPLNEQKFKFIYPHSLLELKEEHIREWIGDVDSDTRLIFYYPEPYCKPHSLAEYLNNMSLENMDIDIIACPEPIDNLLKVECHANCVDKFIGYNHKVHRIYDGKKFICIKDLLEELHYVTEDHF